MKFLDKVENAIVGLGSRIRRLNQRLNPKPHTDLTGAFGTKICGQFLNEEYLSVLSDLDSRMDVYDKMEKSEPVVRLSDCSFVYPILSASMSFHIDENTMLAKKASDKVKEEILEFTEACFKEYPDQSWTKSLYEIATFVSKGFSVFEICDEIQDGKIWHKGLYFRDQRTIAWNFNTFDELESIEQVNLEGNKTVNGKIDVKDLAIFNWNATGANYEGIGLCRYMYRPYYMKKLLMNLFMIGFERYMVATPYLKLAEILYKNGNSVNLATTFNQEEAIKFVQAIRSHEKSGGVLPAGWDLQIQEMNFSGSVTAQKFLEHLDKEMFWASMTQGQASGDFNVGTYASAKEKSDFFLTALNAALNVIADIYNYVLIPRYIDYNFSTPIYPRMELTVSKEDVKSWFEGVVAAVNSNIIPRTKELAEMAAQKLNCPKIDFEKIEEEKANEEPEEDPEDEPEEENKEPSEEEPDETEKPPEDEDEDEEKDVKKKSMSVEGKEEFVPWRELTEYEEAAGGVEYLKAKVDALDIKEKQFQKKAGEIIKVQQEKYLKSIRGKTVDDILAKDAPYSKKYQELAEKYLYDTSIAGMEAVAKESKKKLPPEGIAEYKAQMKDWAKSNSKRLAHRQAEDLKNFVLEQIFKEPKFLQEINAKKRKDLTLEMTRKAFVAVLNSFNWSV